jgi:hypothetical protein
VGNFQWAVAAYDTPPERLARLAWKLAVIINAALDEIGVSGIQPNSLSDVSKNELNTRRLIALCDDTETNSASHALATKESIKTCKAFYLKKVPEDRSFFDRMAGY